MRIGLTGVGSSVDKIVKQAQLAESEGFTSLWWLIGGEDVEFDGDDWVVYSTGRMVALSALARDTRDRLPRSAAVLAPDCAVHSYSVVSARAPTAVFSNR